MFWFCWKTQSEAAVNVKNIGGSIESMLKMVLILYN